MQDTQKELKEMLRTIGLSSVEDLYADVPEEIRADLNLPDPLDEIKLIMHLEELASLNLHGGLVRIFLGGGVYLHHVPPAVLEIASRTEFYSSYTPYQPEVSQGILQAFFEYQSLMARLLNMDVVNASLYDGATALGEAVRMAARITGKSDFILPENIASWKRAVLRNYADPAGIRLIWVPHAESGQIDVDAMLEHVGAQTCGIYVESPNYFGVIETEVERIRSDFDGILVMGTNPISLGLLRPPGDYGADIAIMEGQPLGIPPAYGGPLLGVLACRRNFVRQMPGRLIGMTRDSDGMRAYAMTLQTREQHVRRHKATSNICTNQGLMTVMAAAYLSLMGPRLRDIAEKCLVNAHVLAEGICSIDGFEIAFEAPFFNEFTVRTRYDVKDVLEGMMERGILAGIPLDRPDRSFLVATTEMHTDEDIDAYVSSLKEVVG